MRTDLNSDGFLDADEVRRKLRAFDVDLASNTTDSSSTPRLPVWTQPFPQPSLSADDTYVLTVEALGTARLKTLSLVDLDAAPIPARETVFEALTTLTFAAPTGLRAIELEWEDDDSEAILALQDWNGVRVWEANAPAADDRWSRVQFDEYIVFEDAVAIDFILAATLASYSRTGTLDYTGRDDIETLSATTPTSSWKGDDCEGGIDLEVNVSWSLRNGSALRRQCGYRNGLLDEEHFDDKLETGEGRDADGFFSFRDVRSIGDAERRRVYCIHAAFEPRGGGRNRALSTASPDSTSTGPSRAAWRAGAPSW
mmetsp:Transcript_11724/g.36098  ORF Transcript_11724/g.36098 Transcript_11724/m.36098 type:complete len:312 (+) Transcript_11724:1-936(+)